MRRLALLAVLLLTGCGNHALPTSTAVRAGGVASQSLSGDLLNALGPIAARKAVQAGLLLALKKDAKTAATWTSGHYDQKPDADQLAFLQARLATLQKAVLAARLALKPLTEVDAPLAALDQLDADDSNRETPEDTSPRALFARCTTMAADLQAVANAF